MSNNLRNTNAQNSHLSSLISVQQIQQRRSRSKNFEFNSYYDYYYDLFAYKIRIKRDDHYIEFLICVKVFISIHDIIKDKLEYIQRSLKMSGSSPKN